VLTTFPSDDLTAPEVSADPYHYYGWFRDSDPVHLCVCDKSLKEEVKRDAIGWFDRP
jgi:hypothetical protein